MIQRIQTLYLIISIIALAGLLFLPFGISTTLAHPMVADGKYSVTDHVVLIVLLSLPVLLALLAVFVFKNRPLQVKLTYGLIIISLILPLAAFYLSTSIVNEANSGSAVTWQAGIFLPVISVIAGILAVRSIKKDERLVKSMDRLR